MKKIKLLILTLLIFIWFWINQIYADDNIYYNWQPWFTFEFDNDIYSLVNRNILKNNQVFFDACKSWCYTPRYYQHTKFENDDFIIYLSRFKYTSIRADYSIIFSKKLKKFAKFWWKRAIWFMKWNFYLSDRWNWKWDKYKIVLENNEVKLKSEQFDILTKPIKTYSNSWKDVYFLKSENDFVWNYISDNHIVLDFFFSNDKIFQTKIKIPFNLHTDVNWFYYKFIKVGDFLFVSIYDQKKWFKTYQISIWKWKIFDIWDLFFIKYVWKNFISVKDVKLNNKDTRQNKKVFEYQEMWPIKQIIYSNWWKLYVNNGFESVSWPWWWNSNWTNAKNCRTEKINYPNNYSILSDNDILNTSIVVEQERVPVEWEEQEEFYYSAFSFSWWLQNASQDLIDKASWQYYIWITRADNLKNFNWNNIANHTNPITFDTYNWVSRLWNWNSVIMNLRADKGIWWFKISWSWPFWADWMLWVLVDCVSFKEKNFWDWTFWVDYNKSYDVKKYWFYDVCIKFWNKIWSHTINKIEFWPSTDNFIEKEICVDDDNNITVDWQIFTWSLDNISWRNIIDVSKIIEDDKNKITSWTLAKTQEFILNKFSDLWKMFKLFSITFPSNPWDFKMNIPTFLLKFKNWNGAYFESSSVEANLKPITNKLWVQVVNNSNQNISWWKILISFFMAILYILIRLLIISIFLLPFTLFFLIVRIFTFTFIWDVFWKWEGWGMITKVVSIVFYSIIFVPLFLLFSSIFSFVSVLDNWINILNTSFWFILSSFFDYNFFMVFVNWFFGLLVSSLIWAITLRIVKW